MSDCAAPTVAVAVVPTPKLVVSPYPVVFTDGLAVIVAVLAALRTATYTPLEGAVAVASPLAASVIPFVEITCLFKVGLRAVVAPVKEEFNTILFTVLLSTAPFTLLFLVPLVREI